MIPRWAFYGLLLAAGLTGGGGDILLAKWAKADRWYWMTAGLGSWFACLVIFALLMRYGGRTLGVTFTLEEHLELIKRRAGKAMLEVGLTQLGESVGRPRCCGRPMESHGRRVITVTSRSGEVPIDRTRYRCSKCHAWRSVTECIVSRGCSARASASWQRSSTSRGWSSSWRTSTVSTCDTTR